MNPVPSREEEVFTAALRRPAAGRAAFLAEACGSDAALRGRIEALLEAHEASDRLTCASALAEGPAICEEGPGDTIGRYRLRQKIGEGGCGTVYLAEQAEPVRRKVALKVIKLGMDTKAVVARFEAEQQALALMDHPNIARVLDGGATRTGRPYFVMDLVRGVPLTKFCDDQALSLEARLRLFIQVCSAVQHAHQKGIIHRDLKPSNILVTLDESGAAPKVIDFGIAKAMQGRLVDATLVTAFDQFIGTPAYMSPEQAAPNALDIDTRSDVYSLGVILYELIVGWLPFEAKAFSGASIEEIRRVICEVEPPRPSRRCAALPPAEAAEVARRRGMDAARHAARLAGDLDWIVMRAMEKNRVRRYETPTALAADLTRHLQHEPVMARPPTPAYRLGRLIRRNRLTFAAAAAVTCALLAGLIVSTTQAVRARRAERVAEAERSRAVGERGRADQLLDFMIVDLRQPLLKVGQLSVLERVADKAMEYFASLNPAEMDSATLRRNVDALTQIGELRIDQGSYDKAEAAFAIAYQRAQRLVAREPASREALYARAQAEFGRGNVFARRSRTGAAREWFERYRATAAAQVALYPEDKRWQRELGFAENSLAAVEPDRTVRRARFLASLQALSQLLVEEPGDLTIRGSVANSCSFLGSLAEGAGDLAEAVRRFTEQVEHLEELCRLEADHPLWRQKLADGLCFQANVLAVTGQRQKAAQALARAHELMEALVARDPTNSRWQNLLGVVHLRDGMLAQAAGQASRAAALLAEARIAAESLAKREASDLRYPYRLATALRLEAELQFATNRAEAGRLIRRAAEVGDDLIQREGAKPEHWGERASVAVVAGRIAAAGGDAAQAQTDWQHARKLIEDRLGESKDWRLLDPAVRAAILLGLADEAQSLRARLDPCGYVPLEPWPAAVDPSPIRSETQNPE